MDCLQHAHRTAEPTAEEMREETVEALKTAQTCLQTLIGQFGDDEEDCWYEASDALAKIGHALEHQSALASKPMHPDQLTEALLHLHKAGGMQKVCLFLRMATANFSCQYQTPGELKEPDQEALAQIRRSIFL